MVLGLSATLPVICAAQGLSFDIVSSHTRNAIRSLSEKVRLAAPAPTRKIA
jgi:hypothetical protein